MRALAIAGTDIFLGDYYNTKFKSRVIYFGG